MDKLFVYPALFVASPSILLVAGIIKLDGWINPENAGSVFYTEPRMSADKLFKLIKFRTATKEALQWVRERPERRSISYCYPRTQAGKFIIKCYFDEVPQLFNILKGEMSFVGPRPHIINVYKDDIQKGCFYRKIIKAGLFGIPQACKRNLKHERIFSQVGQRRKSATQVLRTIDGIYANECMNRSIFGLLIFDWAIMARFFTIFMRGNMLDETRKEY